MVAFTRRRELLSGTGKVGLHVLGPGRCRDTNTVREFLYKNFVSFMLPTRLLSQAWPADSVRGRIIEENSIPSF
jgi:hypothetical protein